MARIICTVLFLLGIIAGAAVHDMLDEASPTDIVVSVLSRYIKADMALRYLNNHMGICLIKETLLKELENTCPSMRRFRSRRIFRSYASSMEEVLSDVEVLENATNQYRINDKSIVGNLLGEARDFLEDTLSAYDEHSAASSDAAPGGISALRTVLESELGSGAGAYTAWDLTSEYNQVVFTLVGTYINDYRENKGAIDEYIIRVAGEQELEEPNLENAEDARVFKMLGVKGMADFVKCCGEHSKYDGIKAYLGERIKKEVKESTALSKRMARLTDEIISCQPNECQNSEAPSRLEILNDEYKAVDRDFYARLLLKDKLEMLLKKLDGFEEILMNSCHNPFEAIPALLLIAETGDYFRMVVVSEFTDYGDLLQLSALATERPSRDGGFVRM